MPKKDPFVTAPFMISHGPNISLPSYGPVQSYQDFYQQRWYRKLILLLYLLSLAVGGNTLVSVPYRDTTVALMYPWSWFNLVESYGSWFALNLGILWIFTVLCLLNRTGQTLELQQTSRISAQLGLRTISKGRWKWISSIAWNGTVALLLGISVAFDLFHNWRFYSGPMP